ncbi:hypothetical protein PVAND_003515 [Polypedilum vanderplanki]|uniref:Secreted protein n=1 Tax=Polypedilum vanderplanki TaxID=319348 RepID=A0A9J6BW24_POLVA|nr:hypothetical protein PVAND_003515 [Polypedilum vanderplanki]
MKLSLVILSILICLATCANSLGDAFLRRIFAINGYSSNNNYPNTYNNGVSYQNFKYETTKKPKPSGRSFKDICRAANPAPYSFPNKLPYPSVPIC